MIECDYSDIDFTTLKEKDKFERYKYLASLENIIDSKKDDCFVLQISGQYGCGKTFFVNLLNKYLLEQKYTTLYYNAWEHDYAQDAFVSFCTTFIHHFDTSPSAKGFKNATKNLLINNIPTMLMYCFKEIFGQCTGINADKLIETVTDFAKDVDNNSQQTKKSCNELLDIELDRKNVVDEFRKQLSELIKEKTTEKPLVVFIDDLDRCKPEFAVRLLDYIKHLFNIRGLTFVLAVDDEQLKSTIQQFYGAQNANGYLKRIIDFDFKLPLADYKSYILSLFERYNFPHHTKNNYFVNILNNLGFLFDLSLRDFEQIFGQIHKIMQDNPLYSRAPYMYFVAYIIENYFYKYTAEIAAIETEENKRFNTAQKLSRLFNYKFATSVYYTNSLNYDIPLSNSTKDDFNLQDILSLMNTAPNNNNYRQLADKGFPSQLCCSADPCNQRTMYDKLLEDMEQTRQS